MIIGFAKSSEQDQLMRFIDQHWRKDHILSKHKGLFDWQYLDRLRDRYNFVVAIHDGEIEAILGFIPLCQFDVAIDIQEILWLAIWKVTDKYAGQKLGQRLLRYLDETVKPKIIAANAISESAAHRYLQNGWTLGQLKHWFILNPYMLRYALPICGVDKPATTTNHESLGRIEKVTHSEFLTDFPLVKYQTEDWPCFGKTAMYFTNRYFRHPMYDYEVYRIHHLRRTRAFVVVRTCTYEGASALRIVEYVGPSEALAVLPPDEWWRLLRVTGAEYIDFYNVGIDDSAMRKSGFMLREEGDGYVIPDWFEPYAQKNIEIKTMVSIKPDEDFRIFKGDSDQDRPNMVSK